MASTSELKVRADQHRKKAADLLQRAQHFVTHKAALEALARDYQRIADQLDDLAHWKSLQTRQAPHLLPDEVNVGGLGAALREKVP